MLPAAPLVCALAHSRPLAQQFAQAVQGDPGPRNADDFSKLLAFHRKVSATVWPERRGGEDAVPVAAPDTIAATGLGMAGMKRVPALAAAS